MALGLWQQGQDRDRGVEEVMTLEERVRAALPCICGDPGALHNLQCPAWHRPAVLALLRDLREECAEVARKHVNRDDVIDAIRRIGEATP
jgi:hypothetical protein